MEGPPEILCLGAAHWDVIARAAGPLRRGDDAPGRVARRPGGVALNVALGLARRGRRVGLAAAVGAGADGDALVAACGGLDLSRVVRSAAPCDVYVAVEDGAGELVAAIADTGALDAAGEGLVAALVAGESGGWLFVDGNLSAAALAALARGWRGKLALNPASPAKAARLRPLLPGALVYANRAEAAALTGAECRDARAAAEALLAAGAARAVVTDGPRLAADLGPAGAAAARPGRAAGSVTGAGDALIAAHLDAALSGAAPAAALSAALDAASRHLAGDRP